MYDYNAVQKVLQCIIYSNSQMEFSIKDYLVYKSGQIENIQLQSWPIETLRQYISTILIG